MITKKHLEALERQRPPARELHLRPDDATVLYVRTNLENERRAELTKGYRSLAQEQHRLREQLNVMRNGLTRAQFNAHSHTHECNQELF
jgi:Ribonuclease G/E